MHELAVSIIFPSSGADCLGPEIGQPSREPKLIRYLKTVLLLFSLSAERRGKVFNWKTWVSLSSVQQPNASKTNTKLAGFSICFLLTEQGLRQPHSLFISPTPLLEDGAFFFFPSLLDLQRQSDWAQGGNLFCLGKKKNALYLVFSCRAGRIDGGFLQE